MDIHQPMEWTTTPLGEVTGFQNGYAFKSSTYRDDGAFVIRIGNVQAHGISLNNPAYVDQVVLGAENFLLCEGDMLISLTGNVGRVAVIRQEHLPAVLNQRVARVQPAGSVEKGFLFHLMRSEQVQRKTFESAKGAAQLNISTKDLARIEVPLPPLAEQKVIADKLDTLLAQVDNTKALLERIPQILKRFRQSVLAAAVSGRLTKDYREQTIYEEAIDYSLLAKEERKHRGIRETKHASQAECEEKPFEIPGSWVWRRLGNLALKITDGAHNTPKMMDSGHPYVMAKDLTGGGLDFSEKRYISEKDHRELYRKCSPEQGDLLVVNIGAGTGNNVLVNVDFEFSFKNIAIVKRPSFIIAKYLKFFFDSQKQRIFDEQTRGGAQPFLSLTVLNDIAFALPPLEEQTEIVRRVDQLFAHADRIEQQVNNALARVNNLTQSILAKAFRGELTEQWRKENPELISGENNAEALLERIKVEKVATNFGKRSQKRKT